MRFWERGLARRRAVEEPYGRRADVDCAVCGGAMRWEIVPCRDPKHGTACRELHFGARCEYCGRVVGELEVGREAPEGQRHRLAPPE